MAIEVVFEKRINNAAIHVGIDPDQRRQYFLLVGLASLFVVGLLIYGWQQYQWIQSGYGIASAQKERDELAEYQKQLRVELALKARPERIDKIARTSLGMTLAAPGQTVMLSPDAPMTLPEPPVLETPALTASKRCRQVPSGASGRFGRRSPEDRRCRARPRRDRPAPARCPSAASAFAAWTAHPPDDVIQR